MGAPEVQRGGRRRGSDEWVCKRNKNGEIVMAVRSFYVCLCDCRGTQPECGTVCESKAWSRKNPDVGSRSNKYYCHRWHRYNHSWGQLVQQVISRKTFFMRADVCKWDIEDIRAANMEEVHDFSVTATAEEVYQKAQQACPMEVEDVDLLLEPIEGHDGHFKIKDMDLFKSFPMFEWAQIYTMSGMKIPEKQSKKSKK